MADRRRVLCTLATGPHRELLEIARPTLVRYALRHGYDLVARTDTHRLGGRPATWGKVPLARELLDSYDVVVWIDADAVIVDPRSDIVDTLRDRRPMHVVSHQIDGVAVPNSGVFVMNRCAESIRLLERIWHETAYVHHRWWENAALIAVVGGDGDVGLTTPRSRRLASRVLGALDPRWNSIPACPVDDPAIVHLAGMPHDARRAAMLDLVARSSTGSLAAQPA
ncbi:MAG: hypothetical protein ACRDZZ_13120 [Ilumatobacteraceae bacterium]